ncbi:helix-turn-helix domain-containing protein [Candidatus Woesearchaeota archaeon]|nr:helix-turn-helix domain-containing protein [Candidatus Woesearchaeota archaeon]
MSYDFSKVRHALEEHLAAINENTSEIQALFDYLQELEVKTEKLAARLDLLQLKVDPVPCAEKPQLIPLTQLEKKIFLVLYTETTPLCWTEIAQRTGVPLPTVQECLSSLTEKGIPLLRTYVQDHIFFKINPVFKEQQAKENLVNLSLQSFLEN